MDIGSLISTLAGAAGMRGQSDPYKRESADALKRQSGILDLILQMARGYDPAKETRAATDYASDSAANALAAMQGILNQRYKTSGGSPTGDTNFALQMQRGQDDILGPLMEFVANRKAGEFAQKYNAMLGAAGVGQGLSSQWADLGRYSQQSRQDTGGSQAMLAQGLAGLLGGLPSKSRDYSGYTSQQPFTVGPDPGVIDAAKRLSTMKWF